jgi:hypothetical protein
MLGCCCRGGHCAAGLLFVVLVLGYGGTSAWAQSLQADLRWVEVEVALSPDGRAMVQYKVRWNVTRGTMGAFYFQGEQASIDWHRPGCGAVVDGQRRYDLDLKNLGDRWDVVLAGGQRFGPGEITFVLTYFADYAAAGHVAETKSPEFGELVVFNWAPVQWDEALEHATVLVRWPLVVDQPELTLDEASELGLRTEPFVNQRYKLSYLGRRGTAVSPPVEPAAGDRYLVIRAHRDQLSPKEKFSADVLRAGEAFQSGSPPRRDGTASDRAPVDGRRRRRTARTAGVRSPDAGVRTDRWFGRSGIRGRGAQAQFPDQRLGASG